MCVCVLFVHTLRLPSLRVAALFLGLMFAYDIFMVFVSPLLFHGTSVMVAVATAGAATATAVDGVCERTEGENVPMLMAFPYLGVLASPVEAVYASYDAARRAFPPAAPPSHGFGWRLSVC